MAEQWLSIVEYARTFAVSDMTVRRRIKTGRLRAVLKDGKYYIPINGDAVSFGETALPETIVTAVKAVPDFSVNQENGALKDSTRTGASHKGLPQQITNNLQKFESSLVDSQALIQFCEHSVTRINTIERHLQDIYQAKIQALEADLKHKDQIISQLREQVEDLQILVKLMEKPLSSSRRA